jgi:hypothetical protein
MHVLPLLGPTIVDSKRLPLRHLPYAASMPAARDEFFGDLFSNQERMVHRPAHSAGCGVPRGPIRRGSYLIEHHADRSMNVDRRSRAKRTRRYVCRQYGG